MRAWLNYYYNGTPLIHHVVWKKEYYYKKLVQLTPGPLVHNYIYATMELFFAIKPPESSDFYYASFQLTTFVTNSATLNYPAYIPSLIETSTLAKFCKNHPQKPPICLILGWQKFAFNSWIK